MLPLSLHLSQPHPRSLTPSRHAARRYARWWPCVMSVETPPFSFHFHLHACACAHAYAYAYTYSYTCEFARACACACAARPWKRFFDHLEPCTEIKTNVFLESWVGGKARWLKGMQAGKGSAKPSSAPFGQECGPPPGRQWAPFREGKARKQDWNCLWRRFGHQAPFPVLTALERPIQPSSCIPRLFYRRILSTIAGSSPFPLLFPPPNR
jgi:hypothetical protein